MDYFRPDVFLQPPIQQVLKKYSRPPSGPHPLRAGGRDYLRRGTRGTSAM
jgi:hypothetical protein